MNALVQSAAEPTPPSHRTFVQGLRAMGVKRLSLMGGVTLALAVMLGFLVLRGTDAPMALLYADLDLRDASSVVDQLDRAHIAHAIEAGGSRVLVPADQVSRARLLLAKEGLPSGGSIGYEIFDRGDSLTASGFQQAINQTRALEGELSRTISAIQGVRAARVHLVLAKREPFARDRQDAQASVMLTMAGAARLDREGVQAILNLVAAAVPGLRPQGIAIVDTRGTLLARAGEPTSPAAAAQSADELKRASELRLSHAVEELLERTLGPGHVRAEASVEMDFDQVHETAEKYDPDGQVVRSTQSTNDTSKSTEANQAVSVQNNLPNADAGQNAAGSQDQKQEETTNYEISRTTRTTVRDQPQVRRVSLAVMVDGVVERGADGTLAWRERTPDELARLATLVRGAVGYNEQRGDHVEVVSLRFTAPEDAPDAAPHGWLGLPFERPDLIRLAESGLVALVLALGVLFVLRPMALRLSAPLKDASGANGALAAPGAPSLAGGPAPELLEDDSLVDIANIEGQMRASSIRRVGEMVQRHPAESVAVLRDWMSREAV